MSGALFSCGACGVHLHGSFISLCKCVEQTVEIDEQTVESVVHDSLLLQSWCLRCGAVEGPRMLRSLAPHALPAEADPPDRPCARCGEVTVRNADVHVAFVMSEDWLDGESISTAELLSVAPVCASCEQALVSGETGGNLAAALQFDTAANEDASS